MAITPYLLYADAGAAVDWLDRAFGLRKTGDVFKGKDGRINHASMTFGKAAMMLGSPGADFKGPRAIGHATQNLYVDVVNLAEHYAHAVAAGARIIEEPNDTFYGARRYGAEDLEGHRWYFAQDLTATRKRAKKRRKAPRHKRTAKVRGRKRPARK